MLTDFLRGKIVTPNFLKPAAEHKWKHLEWQKNGNPFHFRQKVIKLQECKPKSKAAAKQNRRVVSERRRGAKVSEFISS